MSTHKKNPPSSRRLGRWSFLAGLSLCLMSGMGLAAAPAVPVNQAPLIIQAPLPPNIALMLDDSGSMNWDVMPDYAYLADTSQLGLIASSNNGVYYNPTITYTIPPNADGSLYPTTSFTSAPVSGFIAGSDTFDLSLYRGADDSYSTSYVGTPTQYSIAVANKGATDYAPAKNCPSGTSLSGGAQPGYCAFDTTNAAPSVPFDFFATNGYFYVSRCKSISDVYNYAKKNDSCTPGTSFFTYAVANVGGGGYTRYYVAKKTGDCAKANLSSAVCDETAATRQNVATWFSYYHTRLLMAKSGLMSAFLNIDATFRVGFGSINGNAKSAITSPYYTFTGSRLASVEPFGDGSAGTQKSKFWNWLIAETASSSTPLQQALDAVGKYYQTAQPWQTADGTTGSPLDTTLLACRQSYTIMTTDGFWNGSVPSGINNMDGTARPKVTGPNGQSFTYAPTAPYSDSASNTLADVAMKYWATDLQPGIANEVTTSNEDPAFWQHMSTFTLGLGFVPQGIAPSGTTVDQVFTWANGGFPISGFSWPTPSSDSINNIADLAHAAVNGHGGFYSATSPQSFVSGLSSALERASARIGTGASLAANSTQLKAGTVTYQANYYTAKWKGDLQAFSVDPSTGQIAVNPTWTASSALPSATTRNIMTDNPSAAVGSQLVTFKTPATLSTSEKAALGSTTAAQQNMINYLRGDSSMEQKNSGGVFRNRDTPLGDIVNSQPVYVGAPNPNQFSSQTFTGSSSYAAYATTQAGRAQVIFVASNDGMLHAFDATTGIEKFAFIPSAVLTSGSSVSDTGLFLGNGLSQLADPQYGTSFGLSHQYFNDGELTIADAYFGSAWHSVAVGTTGRGMARSIYAFDVTDPTNIKYLWSRSSSDGLPNSNFIGQMVGKPVIAQTKDNEWSVLMGNGYNSAAGTSALLQFSLSTGTLSVHKTTDVTGTNGLAAPSIWIGNPNTGISTIAYAGDLHGQVWSFQLNDGTGSTTSSTPTSTGVLLFTAKDSSGTVQSITGGMLSGADPNTGNVWIYFGTGRYLDTVDLTSTSVQSWYGLVVQSTDPTLKANLISQGKNSLVQRFIIAETAGDPTATPAISPARAVTALPSPTDMTGKSGWYMELRSPTGPGGAYVNQGERIVTPNQFQGGLLLTTTRIPKASDPCNPSGSGWVMAVDPFSGTAPSANFFDTNGDGSINSGDGISVTVGGVTTIVPSAGVGFSALPNNPIFVGGTMLVSFDNGSHGSYATAGTGGTIQRVSWREMSVQ